MSDSQSPKENTYFIEVTGSGLPEVDGLFVPSVAPAAKSESGTHSTPGYWNGKMAWDRADGKSARSPAISYSNTYRSWRICRLDGHLAYDFVCEDELPPTEGQWHVYKKGVAPAPKVVIHHHDPRLPCPEPNIVFVLGGPGAGKGTMCQLAGIQLGWVHLSVGELLRGEREKGGPSAEAIEETLAAGKLVGDQLVVGLIKSAMEEVIRTTGKCNFLLDGFPRSLGNMDAWYESFGTEKQLPQMLYFECPYSELEKRILGRAKYSGRSDDNVESLKVRFDTYKAETLPTVQYFRDRDLCQQIDTSVDRQSVYNKVVEILSEFTDPELVKQPLTEQSEILLGIRPYPDA